MSGDYFIYCLMLLNAGACVVYLWEGLWVKSPYWLCVIGLNWCILRLK